MKIIVIGLGNFGAAAAVKLATLGHEVIGIDNNILKVEKVKDKITYSVQLDCTDAMALKTLPLSDSDVILVAIGEDFGASILITAILKKLDVKRLVSRAISPIHRTILEAIGITEILSPEIESAERFVRKIDMKHILDYLNISENYLVVEAVVPEKYIGLTLKDIDVRKKYNINLITIKQPENNKSNNSGKPAQVLGVVAPDYIFKRNDILLIFGDENDIRNWLKAN